VGATQSFTCTNNVYTLTQADIDAGSVSNTADVSSTETCTGAADCTDTVSVPLTAVPGLNVNKTASLDDTVVAPGGVVNVGDQITYGFEATNTGNVTLTNVTVGDSLLGSLNCTPIASLAVGATQSFTCTNNVYTLTQADIDAGSVSNTADVSSTETCTGAADCTDTVSVPLTAVPAINIVKSPATQTVLSGGTASFTLAVTNTGNVTLTNVNVTDAQCTTGPTFTGGDTDADNSLDLTETWTYSCSTAAVMTDFTNIANVNTNEGATDTATADVTVTANQADLELNKSVDNSSPLVATNITFTLTVTNATTSTVAATNVVVSDVIPAGFTYVSSNPSQGTYNNTTGDWSVGTLNIGASATLTITVSVNATGPYTNYAQITGVDQVDPDSTPNDGSTTEDDDASVTVTPTQNNPNLAKTISDSNQAFTTDPNVAIGEIVEYTVAITVPPGNFTNARLVDTMERGLSFMTCSSITASDPALTTDVVGSFAGACSTPAVDDAGGGTTVDVGRRATFNLGTITNASGADQTLTFIYSAVVLDSAANVSGVVLNNSAVWMSDSGAQPPATASVLIVEPDLSILKTANTSLVSVGSEITITLTIQHTATSETNAYDVQVTDALPAELEVVPGTLECVSGVQDANTCNYNSGTRTVSATWSNFTLSGGNGRVTFRVRVLSLPSSGISNVANVAWSSLPGNVSTPQNANVFSTERDYDPGSLIDVYGASDSLVIGVFSSTPATGFAPDVVTDLRNVRKETYAQTGGLTVEIPSLGINIPIVGVPLKNGEWNVSWLGNQAGWLEGSAFPSWSGNSVLTGHVYGSNGLPGPFVNLNKLKYGDKIIIHAYGMKYTYEVRANMVVEPDDASIFRHEEKAWLTLVTCKEYDQKTNTYKKRVVVRAVLVSVE
ncbi:MAG TPA: sortase, partial [Anaerolineales bacterium]|nr:sortase [Anaerolineales bacterium]